MLERAAPQDDDRRDDHQPNEESGPGRLLVLGLLAGLFGTPGLWVIQVLVSQTVAAQSCYPHARPLVNPAWSATSSFLIALNLGCTLLGCLCLFASWAAWQHLRGPKAEEKNREAEQQGQQGKQGTRAGALSFLAHLAFLFGMGFTVALVFTSTVIFFMRDCGVTT